MKILLDTHALLWWWAADRHLTERARRLIADRTNEIFVSAASVWEIATKHRAGKLPDGGRVLPGIDRNIRNSGFSELLISLAHAELAGSLTSEHRDPFDCMLIAQAKLEAMTIITCDAALGPFGVPIIWGDPVN